MSRPKRPALGRGLGALIPQSPTVAAPAAGLSVAPTRELPIEAIEPNRAQPRKRFAQDRLRELADSIRSQGIIQPIVVTPISSGAGRGGRYQILAGERRWRAAQLAGLQVVPVVVRDTPEAQRLELALVENLQRHDLDAIEEARAFEALIELHDYTQAELARRVGKERSTVANALRLLRLPPKVQDALIAGDLGMGHARAILGLESEAQMRELAAEVVARKLNVRQTEAEVRRRLRPPPAPSPEPDDEQKRHEIIVRDLELRIRRHLGVQARLRTGKSGKGPGVVELPYANLDELQALLERLLAART